MIQNIIRIPVAVLCSIVMLYFSRPKLLALPVSVNSFTMFGEVLNINGTIFMYITGIIELIIAIVLFYSLLVKNIKYRRLASFSGYFLLFFTMLGAILTELLIRTMPVNFLLVISIVLCLISLIQMIFLYVTNLTDLDY